MLLSIILENLEKEALDLEIIQDNKEAKVEGFCLDSRKAKANYLFAALKGDSVNGADFTPQAVEKKISVILFASADKDNKNLQNLPRNIVLISCSNPSEVLGIMQHKFYQLSGIKYPEIIAVTGTNGKSSVVNFCEQLLRQLEQNSISVGTLGILGKNIKKDLGMTTPDNVTNHTIITNFIDKNINYIALEASSHALKQNRLSGLPIKVGAITNITQDHCDYHKNFEDYKKAKIRLFSKGIEQGGYAVINSALECENEIRKICVERNINLLTYGKKDGDDIQLLTRESLDNNGQEFLIKYNAEVYKVKTRLLGEFQVENLICTICCLLPFRFSLERIIANIPNIKNAEGRLENLGDIKNNGSKVFLDYAHTPDGLEKALKAVKENTKGSVIVVFGCGGERDAEKRLVMGEIAGKFSDIVVVTDDNPRNENPAEIRKEILKNIAGFNIADRKEAIKYGVSLLKDGDSLLVAGKGHEKTQMINKKILQFSDREEIQKLAG